MRRALPGIVVLAVVSAIAAVPGISQVALLFPSGVAAGDVTPTTAVLWTRLGRLLPVAVDVWPDGAAGTPTFTAEVTPLPDRGGTVKVVATGLRPGTRYAYRFRAGAGAYSAVGTLVTAPPDGAGADLRLAFSGDADGTHTGGAPVHAFDLLQTVAADRPDLFLFVGDTIYSDSSHAPQRAATLEEYRAKYRESQSIPALQALMRATTMVVTWDDHEVENDYDSETVAPAKLAAGRRAFFEAWPVTEQPLHRLYRSFRWGREVELFILDLRSSRSRQVSKTPACANPPASRSSDLAPTLPAPLRLAFAPLLPQMALPVPPECLAALADPNRTLLGPEQKTWLLQGLQRSQATWKFIVSQVPIQEFFASPYDRWEGYAAERAEVLNAIRAGNIKNIVWLSADTHAVLVNDIWLGTFGGERTGMKEVVVGPMATNTFAAEIAQVVGPAVVPAFAAFLQTPLPQGLGLSCAVLDRFTYATVEVSSAARMVIITPRDAAGRPVCRTPLVLVAAS
ncbi:MAG: alkaline phosphatase D family protein [Armatimonadetes bacterium]|nr:alkaline phosphatase D family protein [Armatimonadota bacterium]